VRPFGFTTLLQSDSPRGIANRPAGFVLGVRQRNERKMKVVRPHNGTSAPMYLKHLLKSYRKVAPADAKALWEAWFGDLEHVNFTKRNFGARKSEVRQR
jgi:hypothetical protein